MDSVIHRYEAAERKGRARCPNRAIEAFQPVTFAQLGYPTRIGSLDELWRYHSAMHHQRLHSLAGRLSTPTDAELELFSRASAEIHAWSRSKPHADLGGAGGADLLAAFVQFRQVTKRLTKAPTDVTILEVGPGSGYLGLLLGLSGFNYLALEVTQAFFVHQSELWRSVFTTEYSDGLSDQPFTRLRHVPWWTFNERSLVLPPINAVCCNHALAELHPSALRRVLAVVNRFGTSDVFLRADSLGSRVLNSTAQTIQEILASGWDIEEPSPDEWVMWPARHYRAVARRYADRPGLRAAGNRLLRKMPRTRAVYKKMKLGLRDAIQPTERNLVQAAHPFLCILESHGDRGLSADQLWLDDRW